MGVTPCYALHRLDINVHGVGGGRAVDAITAHGLGHLLFLLLFHFLFLNTRDLSLEHLDLAHDQLFLLLDLFGIAIRVLQLNELLLQILDLLK